MGKQEDDKNFVDLSKENPTQKRIIIATNSLESGITIPYADVVIDVGYELTVTFVPQLNVQFVCSYDVTPKDKSMQRWGRVGRTRPGIIYCCYSESFYLNDTPNNQISNIETSNNYEKYYYNTICLKQKFKGVNIMSNKQMDHIVQNTLYMY